MTSTYNYRVEGTSRSGAVWYVTGRVTEESGNFPLITSSVMRASFIQLTEGHAQFSDLSTCQGPYKITRLIIELTESA